MAWFETVSEDTLRDKKVVPAEVDGLRIALFDLDGEFFATGNICTHQFALLTDGYVEDGCVECPLHQGLFDIRTGKAQGNPVTKDVATYPVKVENGMVFVDTMAFSSTDEPPPAQMRNATDGHRVVIVGGGQSGAQVAQTARDHGFAGIITLVGDETELPYERPPLSKDFLLEKSGMKEAAIFDTSHPETLRLDVRTGVCATSIDRDTRTLHLSEGTSLAYDTLVIATGARARELPVPGSNSAGVHMLRSAADATRLSQALKSAERVVVIGGGFIGLEVASSARSLGKSVCLLESRERLMTRVLPEAAANHLTRIAQDAGVEIVTEADVKGIATAEGRVAGVVLADGRTIPSDLVVVGIGAIPNTQIAADCGLDVQGGIVVDETGRTSDPAIFAVGDVAARRDPVSGALQRLESWQNAKNTAIAVGRSIAGQPSEETEAPWFWSDQFGLSIQILGMPAPGQEIVERHSPAGSAFYCLDDDDRLAGVISFGDAGALRTARQLLESRTPVNRSDLSGRSPDIRIPDLDHAAEEPSDMNMIAPIEKRFVWPASGLDRVPDWVYTDDEIYKREVEKIFHGRTWNFVGLEAELPNAGDYMRSNVGPTSVVVARDEDGSINVFENRCAHRAAEFCRELRGNAPEIVCPYHQWSYDMKGNLKGVPFRRGVNGKGGMGKDFKAENHGLRKLAVTERNGAIFASFCHDMEPIEEYLGEEMLKDFDTVFNGKKLKILGYYRHTLLGNWKLYPENLKDPYHATLLHTFLVTFGLLVAGNKSAMIVDPKGRHSTMASAKSESGAVSAENKKEMRAYRDGMTLNDPRLMDFVPEFDSPWSVTMQVVWPNLIVQREMNTLGVRQIIPNGPNDFVMTWTMFGYEGDDEEMTRHRLRQGNLMGPAGFLGLEDNEAMKFVQDGMLNSTPSAHVVALDPDVPAGTSDTLISEAAIRAMYKHWREEMGL